MTPNSTLPGKPEIGSCRGESSRRRATRVADYEIGGLDKRGREVRDILWSTKEFVIFQHEKGISPHFSDDDDKRQGQQQRYLRLGPAISRVNALLPPPPRADKSTVSETGDQRNTNQGGEGVPQKRGSARRGWSFFHTSDAFLFRETARAIANALEGDCDRAMEILAFVEARLIARRRAQGQFKYLFACTMMLGLIMVVAYVCELWWPPGTPWRDLVQVATCGAAGGFLSVAIGIRKLDVDPDTADWIHAFYGLIRLTIAILSAVVLYILVKGKLVFQPLFSGTPAENAYILYALAVAAGFSETFIPNILRNSEERGAWAPKGKPLWSLPEKDEPQSVPMEDETQQCASTSRTSVQSEPKSHEQA